MGYKSDFGVYLGVLGSDKFNDFITNDVKVIFKVKRLIFQGQIA